jgi:uncharacterized protein (TIGR00730 family)
MTQKITVFGDSKCTVDSKEYEFAEKLGSLLGENNYSLVNGGYAGTMEATFKGAKSFNVEKIAITSKEFSERKHNEFASKVIETESYIERLNTLIDYGDAYVVLPGGTGTLAELSMVWALRERNILVKPIIIIGDQWREVIDTLTFYSVKALDNLKYLDILSSPEEAVDKLNVYFNVND